MITGEVGGGGGSGLSTGLSTGVVWGGRGGDCGYVDVSERVRRVAAGQDGMVTLAQARAAGLNVHEVQRLCRAGRWRVLARSGYLVDADAYEVVPRRARIRAALASFGPGAVAVLGTAAELQLISGLPSGGPVHLSVPGPRARPARRSHPDVVVHQFVIPSGQLRRVAGVMTTSPLRTIADLVLREERFTSVSLLDSALNRRLLSSSDLERLPILLRGRRGAVAARRFLAEANGLAQSPLETRTRLRCVDGGVPPDALQVEVRDSDGYLLGIGDLGWRAARVIAEADGRQAHSGPAALLADRRRQNRLVNAGWKVLRFTWADTIRPDYIPWVVRQAVANGRPPSGRSAP
ncbi:type IV toxin-antitoxin system AbiEi family antitoxin domain-containing protein [Micromonospora sp. WMMC241]|uniref:type IV toxin-antitoxin system AbiEi family antitoxin domain-containing protein n=1 Tax=Micromonospora sp. WMMC241 TaxID=3015159 RepID=UPI0022B6F477|nr:type IV toxin-antitoxin system AbiEi family antitoxin domain-containing protein [Micromonospora sp. WMMC241]MCZ7440477.1 type IV toxin-antitoxin system AbiEi family antitoxin domain-containing protein [Micromonospora sp. WMMC241]